MTRDACRTQNPAIWAGLAIPAAVMATPRLALAVPATGSVLTSDSLIDFGLGVAVGVGLATGCFVLGTSIRHHRAGRQEKAAAAAVVDELAPAESTMVGSHVATDYADIAENYVRSVTLKERMSSRARGVREVLAERLGGNEMDGIPVIARADGSVGDVGTKWWDSQLGDAVRRVGATDAPEARIPDWTEGAASVVEQTGSVETAAIDRRARAARIARRIGSIDLGVFPEGRPAADLDREDDDLWEKALSAMNERIEHPEEEMGALDGIDDPEGLERPTSFIPFRAHTNHPEVVDTESYVEYLIDDEFSQNESQAVRKSSRDYLRVLQGGSQALKSTAKLDRSRGRQGEQDEYRPKHMAPAVGAVHEA